MGIVTESMTQTNDEATPVEVFSGKSVEAEIVKSFLENAGIQAFLQNEMMDALYPVISPGATGCAKVMVSSTDAEVAKEILRPPSASDISQGF